ncbi:MAG: hypothetical protein IJ756_10040 [Paludibacteraceae bacterium]|nr:hypothetical protein [Paludibacteraceae bacterium]
MFKYTKRFISDIRFWLKEYKLRQAEDAEFDKIESIDYQEGYGGHNAMAGIILYKEIQHSRAKRKRLHKEEREAIM